MTGVADHAPPDERYLHSTACVGRLGHLVTAPRDIPPWLCTCSENYRLSEERRVHYKAELARSVGPKPAPDHEPVDLDALLGEVHEKTNHATVDIKVHSRGHVLQPNGTWISWRSSDGLHCRFGDSLEQALRAVLAEVEGEHA